MGEKQVSAEGQREIREQAIKDGEKAMLALAKYVKDPKTPEAYLTIAKTLFDRYKKGPEEYFKSFTSVIDTIKNKPYAQLTDDLKLIKEMYERLLEYRAQRVRETGKQIALTGIIIDFAEHERKMQTTVTKQGLASTLFEAAEKGDLKLVFSLDLVNAPQTERDKFVKLIYDRLQKAEGFREFAAQAAAAGRNRAQIVEEFVLRETTDIAKEFETTTPTTRYTDLKRYLENKIPRGAVDEMQASTMATAYSIYRKLSEYSLKHPKPKSSSDVEAFAERRSRTREFEAFLRENIPTDLGVVLRKEVKAQTAEKGGEVKPAVVKNPKPLEQLVAKLGAADAKLYKDVLKPLLEGLFESGEYDIWNLKGFVDELSTARSRGQTDVSRWFSDGLKNGKFRNYFDKRLTFNAEQLARLASTGKQTRMTLKELTKIKGGVRENQEPKDSLEAERIKLGKLLVQKALADLGLGNAKISEDEKFVKIDADALKQVKDGLRLRANNDKKYADALDNVGLSREDIPEGRILDEPTIKAILIFEAVRNNTWANERANFPARVRMGEDTAL